MAGGRIRGAAGALVSIALVAVPAVATAGRAAASTSTELFFSEYVEGSSNNKALEIYNGTDSPVDLSAGAYSVQMFFNGSTTPGLTINLTGTVAPSDVFVLAQSSASPAILAVADQTNGSGWFNGDDAVVLRRGTTIVDSIGQVGFDPGTEWGSGNTSTADNTLRRSAAVVGGDTNASDAFDPSAEWDGFATDTFGGLGGHLGPTFSCPAVTGPAGSAIDAPVSASDADGTVVDIAITEVTPSDPGTFSRTAFTPADAVGGTATATITASPSTPTGTYALTLTATTSDEPPQTGTCVLTITVATVRTIGEVQGEVTDADNGSTHASPFVGQTVLVRGVVAERTLARSSSGSTQRGFFLQETDTASDGNPLTSDGIFVFMSGFTSLIGGYVPVVGDEVVIRANVSEFFNLTELTSASLVSLVRSGVDLDAELPAFEADPPDVLADAQRYWERHEGMRARIPAGSLVVDGRNVFPSTADSELWVIHPDHPVAQRTDPFARRVFRDPHPLDNEPSALFDDGNGYRIVLGPMGVKAASGDTTELLVPATTFDTISNALVGGVYFSFGKYQIEITEQPTLAGGGVAPDGNAPPQPADRASELAVATFNVENLYDYRDDPFDGCDFAGNSGCPGVSPPFDYVPASAAEYEDRLGGIASQIVNALRAPDLLLIQEAEDQDVCTVVDDALSCGTADDADGRPDTLQELALAIEAIGGPSYDAAYDRDGADDRGIVSAFLYRTDRVELLAPAASDPVLGSDPGIDYRATGLAYNTDVQNPKAVNAELPDDVDRSTGVDGDDVFTRAPQVGHFRFWRDGIGASLFVDAWAVSNHFSSTPTARVGQRTEQARYNAAVLAAIEAVSDEPVLIGGDLNVYPRPDDPFAPGDPRFPSDQLGPLYDAGLENLWTVLAEDVPAAAYSYVFDGQAQTLDHLFVNDAFDAALVTVRAAHVNADYPADLGGDDRGVSDHDPQVARFAEWPTLDQLAALVRYLADTGAVSAKAEPKLLDQLARAQRFLDRGNLGAYVEQLQSFIDQVESRTPSQITPAASAALVGEAEVLIAATS